MSHRPDGVTRHTEQLTSHSLSETFRDTLRLPASYCLSSAVVTDSAGGGCVEELTAAAAAEDESSSKNEKKRANAACEYNSMGLRK